MLGLGKLVMHRTETFHVGHWRIEVALKRVAPSKKIDTSLLSRIYPIQPLLGCCKNASISNLFFIQ